MNQDNDTSEHDFDSEHGMGGGHFGSDPDSPSGDESSDGWGGNGDRDVAIGQAFMDAMNAPNSIRDLTLGERIGIGLGLDPSTVFGDTASTLSTLAKLALQLTPAAAPAMGLYSLADAVTQRNYAPVANFALSKFGVDPSTRALLGTAYAGITRNPQAISNALSSNVGGMFSDPRVGALASKLVSSGISNLPKSKTGITTGNKQLQQSDGTERTKYDYLSRFG